jgi:hypothetical protein
MPIGNISKAGKSFSGAAEYDLAQGKYAEQENSKKPEILEQNFVFGNDYKDLGKQFREVSNENKRVESPVMKVSISFDTKENLSESQKIEFTKKVMKEMGIREDNHQYMITRHSDKKHDHHHVLANRVGMDRKVIDYSHSIPRLEKSIDKVEKEMKLNNDLSKTRRYVFDEKNEKGYKVQKENFRSNREKVSTKTKSLGVAEKKDYIKNSVEKSLQESKSVSDLQSKLQEKNISVEARFDKANKLTGISFKYDNLSVKGSAMGKEFKASGIEKEIKNNIDRENIKPLPKVEIESREVQELRKETLQNLDKAIEKIEPYKEANLKTYESVKTIKQGVQRNELNSKEDLQKINQMAKNHISNIEAQEQKPEIQQNYDRFDQAKANKEAKQEQERDQEKKRGFRR